ncbi:hypothetical protein ACH5RR_012645 [Cinchona calisaya]|uniref:Receptor-like serine/threonine-protein kinase n=1 Tax=Cinchona calisaya TaxID=153742 RepID=A0ABD3A9T9_9GENT
MAYDEFFRTFLPFLVLVHVVNSEPHTNITLGSRLYPQNTSLISPSGTFGFGFYKKADGFAVGIWMIGTPEPIVTWAANRDGAPLSPEAFLELNKTGQFLIWSQPIFENLKQPATSASLLDSGNFVIYNGTEVIWESFQHPTDTILGGQVMTVGDNLVSSVSSSDQSVGRFAVAFQYDGNLVAYLNTLQAPLDAYWSTGTFGKQFENGRLILTETGRLYLNFSVEDIHKIAAASSNNNSLIKKATIYRAKLDPDGNFRLYSHIFDKNGSTTMTVMWSALQNMCEVNGFCGVNSYCSSNIAGNGVDCFCFPGFLYFDWKKKFLGCYQNFTSDSFCARKENSLSFNVTLLQHMKIGGYPYAVMPMLQAECNDSCMNDCDCFAAIYASGTCSKFTPPLINAKRNENQSEIAIVKQSYNNFLVQSSNQSSLHHPSAEEDTPARKSKWKMIPILIPPFGILALFFTVLAVFSFLLYQRRAHEYQKLVEMENLGPKKEFTLQSFSYSELEKATEGFKEEIGSCSYGKIYGGIIPGVDGKVAVKRLETSVDEGETEFAAEMTAMGRVRHKNVIQLIGFCLDGAKKLLVYELMMNNRSLEDILYNDEMRPVWKERMRIALDVARGIHYLHEGCEFCIVHCNIRPKSILLNKNWTAKISNFGSAKLLMPNQKANLAIDVERLGYSAPEWQRNASISEKVDVYSYGIVLLEIICCTSNIEHNNPSKIEAFPTRLVYDCFMAKELRKLIGDEQVDLEPLERTVKVGLCCIQNDPNQRPSMKTVILMLEGNVEPPVPPPAIFS